MVDRFRFVWRSMLMGLAFGPIVLAGITLAQDAEAHEKRVRTTESERR